MANAAKQESATPSKNEHEARSADDANSPLATLPNLPLTPLFRAEGAAVDGPWCAKVSEGPGLPYGARDLAQGAREDRRGTRTRAVASGSEPIANHRVQ